MYNSGLISSFQRLRSFIGLAMVFAFFFFGIPNVSFGQDDSPNPEKTKKEKAEKPKKEKPEKPVKEKKEKPVKEKKAKPEKEKKAKNSDDEGGDDDAEKADSKREKKKKKNKKDADSEVEANTGDGANTANERFHANNSDSTYKHGRAVPCARYRKGGMEYWDKNNIYVAIKRTKRREIHINENKGIRGKKEKKSKKGKSKDKGNKLVFRIKWQADCEYKLIFKRSKKPTKFKKGWEMDCRIIACYEDYYDCDCDIHDIMQYASIHKRLTKRELAQREILRQDSIKQAEADSIATVEEIARLKAYEEEEKARAANDEIFGPIRRNPESNDQNSRRNNGQNEEKDAENKEEKPEPDNVNSKAAKTTEPKKEKPEKDNSEKDPDSKPEKEEKTPKEKKEKAPKEKKEKAPKEKKEKEPKEKKEKVPKEKKEKAPKEKKEKAPKSESDAEE